MKIDKVLITVDCREVEHLKHEMAVFVSDWLGMIPSMKLHEFVLSSIDDRPVDFDTVVQAIKEFFASIGETTNYGIMKQNGIIQIRYAHGEKSREPKPAQSMFSCTHCGYVTPYEVLLHTHMKLHYL